MRVLSKAAVAALLVIAWAGGPTSQANAGEFKWWHKKIGLNANLQNKFKNGAGVRVGVLDGLADWTHSDLSARIDRYATFSSGSYTTFDSHGTHVAGIVGATRGNGGIVGIAPKVKITTVGMFDDTGFPGTVEAGLDAAWSDGATVSNMSFGPTTSGLLAFDNYLSAISKYRTRMVISKSAGNDGVKLKNISWNTKKKSLKNMIIVGAVDNRKKIASFSNKPGNGCFTRGGKCRRTGDRYKYHFLVAPGVDILSTVPGGYGYKSGTSMAAPVVAGAAALLQSKWKYLKTKPFLTKKILLQTAEDLGKKGIDNVYGRGMLRLDRAFQSNGKASITTGATVNGSGYDAHDSYSYMPTAFGDAKGMKQALNGAVFFDKYGRDFQMNPDYLVRTSSAAFSMRDHFERRFNWGDRNVYVSTPVMDGSASFMGLMPMQDTKNDRYSPNENKPEDGYFGLTQSDDAVWRTEAGSGNWKFSFGQRLGLVDDLALGTDKQLFMFNTAQSEQPLMGLGDQRMFSFGHYQVNEKFGVGMGFAESSEFTGSSFTGFTSTDPQGTGRSYLMQADFKPTDRISLQVTQTFLDEEGMMLGGVSSGALGFGNGAQTFGTGAAMNLDLTAGFSARLHYTEGLTNASTSGATLFQDVDAMSSRAYGLSLMKKGIFGAFDQFGVSVSKPMQIYDGAAYLNTPVGRTVDGRVNYRRSRVDLAPSGSQTDYDIAYRTPLGEQVSLGLNAFYQDDAGHEDGAMNAGVLGNMRFSF
ncbi:S8 family serine peptidase [Methyloligella sp. 2.7D]|uniref:S8 family peptidase n=1 Tax=unclassified Methyloligella TaxID=2625955 RepID=UPI00157DA389|nr:S8 family serine peptidase [Methyloligella sp. GL2]QKP76419.1 S8 family serine peptidase [Methyloligella sp. GL2]